MRKSFNDAVSELKVALKAAWIDTQNNLLHPVRNLKIAFGLEEGESWKEILRKAEQGGEPEDEGRMKVRYKVLLSNRLPVSEEMLDKFSGGDLKSYFNRVTHPEYERAWGAVGQLCIVGATAAFIVGTAAPAVQLAAICLAGVALTSWAVNARFENEKVMSEMTERVARQAASVPPAPRPAP